MMNNVIIHIPHSSLNLPDIFYSKIHISKEEIEKENIFVCDYLVDKFLPSNFSNIIKFEYDSLGRQIAVCDENFNITKYEYNALGLISKVIKSDNSIEFYEYDKFGNISTIIDEKGVKVEYSYDNLGILLSTNERAEN